jgi:hypothetical protein
MSNAKKGFLILAAIWIVAGGLILLARQAQPTAESVSKFAAAHPVASLQGEARARHLERLADQINRLAFEDRRELRMNRAQDETFRALTPEEQARFLDRTLPSGMTQMMEAFNKMEPAKRKRFVDRALEEMRSHAPAEAPPVNDAHLQRIVAEGLKAFYNDSSAETKMDLAPLIEEMQRGLQNVRR